jgi:hypothetical protein
MNTSLARRTGVALLSATLLLGLLPESGWAAPRPKISASIQDVVKAEGNAGTTAFAFTVSLSQAPSSTVGLKYATAPGTALAGADYVSASGSLSFAPGTTERTVEVLVKSDLDVEPDEGFSLNLSGGGRAVRIVDALGLATIVNDDRGPAISITDVTIPEGDSGTRNAVMTVSLTHASANPVSVDYTTLDGNANAGLDYIAANGTVVFSAGDTAEPVAVPVNGDALDENDESLDVSLSNSSPNAWISDGLANATILDDDVAPKVAINDVVVTEPASGSSTARFTASLSGVSGKVVEVHFTTADAVDNPAAPGSDYNSTAGLITFNPGERVQHVDVVVHADGVDEPDETFALDLSNPVESALGSKASGIATIVDDDPTPSISIGDAVVDEGNSGSVEAVFPITLSAPASEAVTLDYSTTKGSASAGSDYIDVVSDSVTFAAGDRTQQISIVVNGDTVDEINETFTINLATDSAGALVGRSTAEATIVDDDKARTTPSVAIVKFRRRIAVRGRLTPAAAGVSIVVKLYKRNAAGWALVRTRRPLLGPAKDLDGDGISHSSYGTRFKRPRRARRFKVIVRYLGDEEHLSSRAMKRFRYR